MNAELTRERVIAVVRDNPGAGCLQVVRLLGGAERGATVHNVDAHLGRAVAAGQLLRSGKRGAYAYHAPGGSSSAPMAPSSLEDARAQRAATLERLEHDRRLVVAIDAFIAASPALRSTRARRPARSTTVGRRCAARTP